MNGDDLTIIVPLWKRTTNMARLVESIDATVPEAEIIWVVSADDDAARVGAFGWSTPPGAEWERSRVLIVDTPGGCSGDYARKINAGYRASTRPVLFTGADDIVFTDGWYDAARDLLDLPQEATQVLAKGATLTGPFNMLSSHVGVVGTNDGCNGRTFNPADPFFPHSTHSLVARWYADQGASWDGPNVIYHEGYEHEYCDDELVQTAIMRGSYAHALDSHVTHLHPNAGAAPDDETYQRGRSRTRMSHVKYRHRQRLWGGQRR